MEPGVEARLDTFTWASSAPAGGRRRAHINMQSTKWKIALPLATLAVIPALLTFTSLGHASMQSALPAAKSPSIHTMGSVTISNLANQVSARKYADAPVEDKESAATSVTPAEVQQVLSELDLMQNDLSHIAATQPTSSQPEDKQFQQVLSELDLMQNELSHIETAQPTSEQQLEDAALPAGAVFVVGILALLGVIGQLRSTEKIKRDERRQDRLLQVWELGLSVMTGFETVAREARDALATLRGRALQGDPDEILQNLRETATEKVGRVKILAGRLATIGVSPAILDKYTSRAAKFINVAREGGSEVNIENAYASFTKASDELQEAITKIGDGLHESISKLEPADSGQAQPSASERPAA